jgi:hypothetical protein
VRLPARRPGGTARANVIDLSAKRRRERSPPRCHICKAVAVGSNHATFDYVRDALCRECANLLSGISHDAACPVEEVTWNALIADCLIPLRLSVVIADSTFPPKR